MHPTIRILSHLLVKLIDLGKRDLLSVKEFQPRNRHVELLIASTFLVVSIGLDCFEQGLAGFRNTLNQAVHRLAVILVAHHKRAALAQRFKLIGVNLDLLVGVIERHRLGVELHRQRTTFRLLKNCDHLGCIHPGGTKLLHCSRKSGINSHQSVQQILNGTMLGLLAIRSRDGINAGLKQSGHHRIGFGGAVVFLAGFRDGIAAFQNLIGIMAELFRCDIDHFVESPCDCSNNRKATSHYSKRCEGHPGGPTQQHERLPDSDQAYG